MKLLFLASLLSLFVTITSPIASGRSWRQIVPLKTTRAEVERDLGKPVSFVNHWATYRTETDVVSILYSNGLPCGKGANSEWKVPANVVVSITVAPKNIVLFTSLNIDESQYQKIRDPHKLNAVHYANLNEGESISVTDGEVSSFRYTAGAASKHLACENDHAQPITNATYKLDEYGRLGKRDEESRLGNFAIALTQQPESKGYIFSYSDASITSKAAYARARMAKKYLVRIWGIKAARLIVEHAGNRSDFTIELYIAPKGSPGPVPFGHANK